MIENREKRQNADNTKHILHVSCIQQTEGRRPQKAQSRQQARNYMYVLMKNRQ
jgi:hypothetical protein